MVVVTVEMRTFFIGRETESKLFSIVIATGVKAIIIIIVIIIKCDEGPSILHPS